jgi:hypothetical protein
VTWNSTTATNGTHTLTAVATDAAGNPATSASVAVTVSNTTGGGVIFGDSTPESFDDATGGGTIDAYQYTNSVVGSVTRLGVYITGAPPTQLRVGVYADSSGRPGSLLASCAISSVATNTFNTCTLTTALTVTTAGTPYWIAVLTPSGSGTQTLRINTSSGTNCWSNAGGLASLPMSFGAATCGQGKASAYAAP